MVPTTSAARAGSVHREPLRRLAGAADELDRLDDLVPAAPLPIGSMRVGAADDPAERDADRRADDALRRLGSGSAPGPDAHRHGPDCEHVRRRSDPGGIGAAGGDLDAETSNRIAGARGGGQQLPATTRARMEQAFASDFGDVRVHADGRADELNRTVSARAFTTGSDLFFAAGQYDPTSAGGERVLAHELAHVVQESGPGRARVRRLMSVTSRDIGAVRSSKGSMKGSLTKDTLYRLGRLLDDYHKINDPKLQLLQVDHILGLCDAYLAKHGTVAEDAKKVALVEDIHAQAFRERGVARAQTQYLGDAYGTSAPTAGGTDTTLKHQRPATLGSVQAGSKALGSGKTAAAGYHGADAESLRLVKLYGLTEAEVLAIRLYTGDDFKYINPSTANNQGWLSGTLSDEETLKATKDPTAPEKDAEADQQAAANAAKLSGVKAEGVLHSGVAMQALAKLPVKAGLTYRGARATQAEFDRWYEGKTVYRFDAFASSAVSRKPAEDFQNGVTWTPKPEQTISIMCELTTINARDIRNFSIFGAKEDEWLLLPGATFTIDSIVEEPTGTPGKPVATKWYLIKMTQTK